MIELAAQLPPPSKEIPAEKGYTPIIRLPLCDWDAVRDSEHPERELDAHEDAYVEFEVIPWKDTRGFTTRRWVLRGLIAI